MTRILHRVSIVMMLLAWLIGAERITTTTAAQDKQGAAASQQDKVKACNTMADKKGLKGDDRKNFMQSCINKASDAQPLSDMSQKDKLNACKNLADRRNLTGEDRRSFLKDCMNKANPK